ncbi:MAG: DUF1232 domain-containing protein [Acidobacteriota bacterium]|jgi:uncharacterized membrane protein YkvA (DUF1232 family)|nr:DUF1232 domain-containing protein [Acidobacteriota bacterium]
MVPRIAKMVRGFLQDGWVKEALLALPRVALLIPKLLGDRRVPLRTRAALFGLGIYLASPLDIIPDFIPGLGQVDDALALLLLVDGILNQVDEQILFEHWTGRAETLRRLRDAAGFVAAFVPARFQKFLYGKVASLGRRYAPQDGAPPEV